MYSKPRQPTPPSHAPPKPNPHEACSLVRNSMLNFLQPPSAKAHSQTARRRVRGCLEKQSWAIPAFTILLALCGCDDSQRERQAVLDQLKFMEGHKLHDFPTLTHTATLVMQNPLKSGNVEYQRHASADKCAHIFEVDPQTDVIVKARLSAECKAP